MTHIMSVTRIDTVRHAVDFPSDAPSATSPLKQGLIGRTEMLDSQDSRPIVSATIRAVR